MHAQKLVAGALLAGMTIVTGEATLIATAGGVGVNWLAEGVAGGLAGLRPARGGAAGPLATAYAAAIRQAAAQLQADYTRTVDPRSDAAAFALVAACAQEVAAAEFPAAAAAVDTAQAVLAQALDALLLGHDPRQVDYLRGRLLPVCAAAFQQQLVADAGAWRAFHGLLLQALAANVLTLGPKLERFDAVLAAFSDPTAALHALRQGTARLEASAARIETTTAATQDAVARLAAQVDDLAERPPAGGATFHNQGMTVHGGLYQAERQYFGSAHAAEGGTALVVNNLGTPPTPPASAPPLTILVLAANPLDTARVRLDAEVRAIDGALRQGEAAMRWTLHQQWAVRSGDLVDALLRFRPTVVHFAGHGAADGSLLVEDLAGMSAALRPAAIAALLAAVPGVQVVVLNACWSDAQAAALLEHVACVVGMTEEVTDAAAVAFAAGFHRGLAAGEAVATAVALGRAQVTLETGSPEQARLAQLRVRDGVDAAGVIQVGGMAATPRVSTLG